MQFLYTDVHLESIFIDILVEFIKSFRGNEFASVIVGKFTKLVKTVPLNGLLATEVGKGFVN